VLNLYAGFQQFRHIFHFTRNQSTVDKVPQLNLMIEKMEEIDFEPVLSDVDDLLRLMENSQSVFVCGF
jgi:hypothetical protein